jgi:glutaredoxin
MQGAMTVPPLPELYLYTRAGCHLCDEARAMVQGLLEDRAAHGRRTAAIRERDIETHPEWERQFFATIPVVEVGGRRLELATSPAKLRRFLDEALDGALV